MPSQLPGPLDADRVRLLHMLDAARKAVAFASRTTRERLSLDDLATLGLVKCIELLGEAANRVSVETTQRIADVPWRSIIAMRHRTVHGYDDINLDIVWVTATQSLPPLIAALEAALANWPDAKQP
jgi:uncharacterized protein with HEPN domain